MSRVDRRYDPRVLFEQLEQRLFLDAGIGTAEVAGAPLPDLSVTIDMSRVPLER